MDTFNKLDEDSSGFIEFNEILELLKQLEGEGADIELLNKSTNTLMETLDKNRDGKISFEEFSIWYLSSEERIISELHHLPEWRL